MESHHLLFILVKYSQQHLPRKYISLTVQQGLHITDFSDYKRNVQTYNIVIVINYNMC